MFHGRRWCTDERHFTPMVVLNDGTHIFVRDCISFHYPLTGTTKGMVVKFFQQVCCIFLYNRYLNCCLYIYFRSIQQMYLLNWTCSLTLNSSNILYLEQKLSIWILTHVYYLTLQLSSPYLTFLVMLIHLAVLQSGSLLLISTDWIFRFVGSLRHFILF